MNLIPPKSCKKGDDSCDIPNFTTTNDRFVYALFEHQSILLKESVADFFCQKYDKDFIKSFPKKCISLY